MQDDAEHQLLRGNPEVARKIKANDLGKLSWSVQKVEKQEPVVKYTDPEDEPWKDRISAGQSRKRNRVLVELSD